MRPPAQPIEAVLVDLDDTLYRVPDIPEIVRENIQQYMETELQIPPSQIPDLCLESYTNFGTTMAGLVSKGYRIDADAWHAAVHHTLPYAKFLKPEPAMRSFLEAIKLPKYIFTNADIKHAKICLQLMGLDNVFDGIICFEGVMQLAEQKGISKKGVPVVCKPHAKAFELALEMAGNAQPETTLFLDDSTRNINGAHRAGLKTVLVGRTAMPDVDADLQVLNLLDLPKAHPTLWSSLTQADNKISVQHPEHSTSVPLNGQVGNVAGSKSGCQQSSQSGNRPTH